MDGKWESTDTWDGIKSGMVEMAPYGDAVPKDVREMADKIKASIIDGSFHPFQGPIKNQKGELVVKEGETISDGDLAKLKGLKEVSNLEQKFCAIVWEVIKFSFLNSQPIILLKIQTE